MPLLAPWGTPAMLPTRYLGSRPLTWLGWGALFSPGWQFTSLVNAPAQWAALEAGALFDCAVVRKDTYRSELGCGQGWMAPSKYSGRHFSLPTATVSTLHRYVPFQFCIWGLQTQLWDKKDSVQYPELPLVIDRSRTLVSKCTMPFKVMEHEIWRPRKTSFND